MNLSFLLHQTVFGAIAAAGFGVLFNVPWRRLPWCGASGAVALAVRTTCQGFGLSLIGASFVAALMVGIAAHLRWKHAEMSRGVMAVVGCIPMVPGSLASKAILGLFALARSNAGDSSRAVFDAAHYSVLVAFTIGAIGTGLVIPTLVLRGQASRPARVH